MKRAPECTDATGSGRTLCHARGEAMMRRRDGFLLVTVLFVMVVVAILALGTSFTALIDRQVAARQRVGTEAHYLAQAGMDRLKTALFLELSNQARSDIDICGFPPFEIDLGGGVTLRQGETSAPLPFEPVSNGWYVLSFERSGGYFVLNSVGYLAPSRDAEQRSAQATMQLVAAAGERPSRVWDNAIFARALTSGSGSLTGTIAAYGSVHIVNGDFELVEDEALITSGSSGIFNNYGGRSNSTNVVTQARNALGMARTDQQPNPRDLCSRLKIARGDVLVRTNAVGIGAEGDTYLEDGTWIEPSPLAQVQSIKGVYLGSGDVVDQQGNPLSTATQRDIFSRTGVSGYEGFDLSFPALEIGFPHALGELDADQCGLIIGNELRLPPVAVGSVGPCLSRDGESSIEWDETNQVLKLNGVVSLPAGVNVRLEGRTGNSKIDVLEYEGIGAIMVGTKTSTDVASNTGRVDIDVEILPRFADSNYRLGGDALSLVTAGDIYVDVPGGGGTVSALLYADRRIEIDKQPTIVGSVVGRSVNVHNVPKVAFHPDMVDIAELLCLPGTVCDVGDFGNRAPWSEVSVEVR
jgi:hypothetical protein